MQISDARRRIGPAALSVLLACATGCHHYKPLPTRPTDDPGYKPGGVARGGIDKDVPVPLVLLTGDTLTVRTISNESFEYAGLVVDGEGKIHLPAVGPVSVAGLPLQVAEKRVEDALQRYDRFARASLLVSDWGGHNATLIGAVSQEGIQPVLPGMKLAELVAAAGGPLRTNLESGETSFLADLDGARLVREGKTVPISLRLALDGDPRHNVLVHAGDQLFVPAGLGSRIAILGNVGGAQMLTHRPGLRLSEALASSGGITIDADDNDVRVIRGPIEDPTVYQWSLQQLVEDKHGDVELAPGDIVFVSEHWVAQMGEVLNRIAPLLALASTGLNTYLVIRSIQIQNAQIRQQNNILRNQVGNQNQNLTRGMSGMSVRALPSSAH